MSLDPSRVSTVPNPEHDPDRIYSNEFMYQFDASSLAAIREMADCSKIRVLDLEAKDTGPSYVDDIYVGYTEPAHAVICDDLDFGLDMSGMIRERQTEYGELSVGTARYSSDRYYIFQLDRDDGDTRFSAKVVFAQP